MKHYNKILFSGLGTIILLTLLLGLFFLHLIQKTQHKINDTVYAHETKLSAMLNMHVATRDRILSLQNMFLAKDPFLLDQEWMHFQASATQYLTFREKFLALATSDESESFHRINLIAGDLAEVQNTIAEHIHNDEFELAEQILVNVNDPLSKTFIEQFASLTEAQQRNTEAFFNSITTEYEHRLNIIALVSILVIFTLILIASILIFNTKKFNQILKNTNFHLEQKVKARTRALEKLSITDPLTQLYNRTRIEKKLITALNTLKNNGTPFGVLFMDIDYFKQVNDQYGHGAGDETLKGVASLIKQHFKCTDTYGRWGGEEFVVVCPEAKQNKLQEIAETFRLKVKGSQFIAQKTITVSIGMTIAKTSDDYETLLKRADDALYKAKNLGRDRVIEHVLS